MDSARSRLASPRFLALALLAIASAGPGSRLLADELTPRHNDYFEIHVRPTLVTHCIECHGEEKQEGGLKLTSRADLLQGGVSGPAVVPGQPEQSLLLEAVRYESLEMPPAGPLDSQVADALEAWIQAGAAWPQGAVLQPTPKISPEDRQWWCYQPVADPPVPEVGDDAWCRNEIDRFILARLEQEGIEPAAEADPRTLTRRVHFATTGLPPQPQAEIAGDSAGYEALVDRLLEDPAYGENQARFWLDLVRYADSDGYNADHARPEAHHYRDYVIRSFNADKPYDRFVTEQLAGDEVDPGNRDALIATMYLRHWIYEWNQRDVEGQWQEILNDITENVADVFLAQGLKCARCHDHKFDPLLQEDYFRLQAFFAPFQPTESQPIADLQTRKAHYRQQRKWDEATDEIRARLHAIETPVLLEHATREGVDKFVAEIREMIAKRPSERTPYEHQIASLASRQFDVHPDKLPEWLDEDTEAERQRLRKRLAEFDHLKPEPLPTMKFVASDVGPVAPPTVIPDDPEPEPIQPGFPAILEDEPAKITPPPEALQSTGRRTALARWITDPENPLTARVIVNRIWQQHFGRGLVDTSSDFGRLGTPPTHPKLLDWLASRFVEDGWSIKKLHRRILTSATYRQTSQRPLDDQLAAIDPENTLLWRANPRRLAAEEIHDTLLTASGELEREKRAIYKTVKRNRLDPLLKWFDFPDRIRSQCKRHRTTTSPQALLMMNDPWVHQRAAAMAEQLEHLDGDSFVRAAYRRLFFRQPDREELAMASQFRSSYRSLTPEPESPKRIASMADGRPAIQLDADEPTAVQIPWFDELPVEDFTVEATVMLGSLYPNASVRTIAAHWSGDHQQPGWALGVTSTQSAYEPRNLILQLVGSRGDGGAKYEVIASDLRLELNKPYHVAVAVDLDDLSDQGVTFAVKDLSVPGAEPKIAHVPHHASQNIRPRRAVEIGGRSKKHLWDGLIHNVRLHDAALDPEQLAAGASEHLLFDVRFGVEARAASDASGHGRHATVENADAKTASPQRQTRQMLLHALLNSNETIYVD